jgi:hypothetical protein
MAHVKKTFLPTRLRCGTCGPGLAEAGVSVSGWPLATGQFWIAPHDAFPPAQLMNGLLLEMNTITGAAPGLVLPELAECIVDHLPGVDMCRCAPGHTAPRTLGGGASPYVCFQDASLRDCCSWQPVGRSFTHQKHAPATTCVRSRRTRFRSHANLPACPSPLQHHCCHRAGGRAARGRRPARRARRRRKRRGGQTCDARAERRQRRRRR